MVQQISFTQKIKDLIEKQEVASSSSLKTLHPFIDKEGLLRVGGRLQESTLPYQAMHQMILPANHHFTKLVVSAERRLHAIERRLERDPELKVQYHNFVKVYKDLGHMEPVNSQNGKNTCYFLPHHPVFKETSSTTRPRIAFDGSAKPSNGTQHNNQRVLPVDRFFYCVDMDTLSTKQIEDICRQQSCSHSGRNIRSNMDRCAISIQSY
jgi:hypothetical protein